jgi:hypothetical protein
LSVPAARDVSQPSPVGLVAVSKSEQNAAPCAAVDKQNRVGAASIPVSFPPTSAGGASVVVSAPASGGGAIDESPTQPSTHTSAHGAVAPHPIFSSQHRLATSRFRLKQGDRPRLYAFLIGVFHANDVSPYRTPSAPRRAHACDVLLAALFPELCIAWVVSVAQLLRSQCSGDGAVVPLVVVVLAFPLLVASAVEAARYRRASRRT